MRQVLFFFVLFGSVAAAEVPVVNYENHPVHALDRSPDGTWLAVAHTADQRVQLFDIREGHAVYAGHVAVGTDPVSVRFRTENELWVVNHISDSVSVVDVSQRRVTATLQTRDEPFDVVFAGTPERAWVSSSRTNSIQVFDPLDLSAQPQSIPLRAEEPRALAVSPDGQTVYVALFESGNGTTLVAGSTEQGSFPPNGARETAGPYGGVNPPPNLGNGFSPAMAAGLPEPPPVGIIVRKNAAGRWMDDNGGNWTPLVSGGQAARSGRVNGWDLPDRDLAEIDTNTGSVTYHSGLMNIGMALAIHPDGTPTPVGTDATNEIRFEPNLTGTFVRVLMARPDSDPVDLNDHLDYTTPRVSQSERDRSLGDPRAILWQADGQRGFVVGMGSNNLLVVGPQGQRLSPPVEVGEGPTGLALSSGEEVLYVWNHFEASLSVLSTIDLSEMQRLSVFNPLPESIQRGRRAFYDTHETSGLGQASCASCHVDGRSDRLAWDLGDPSGQVKAFAQNCGTSLVAECDDFHPMKGPMTTQTLQDIIGMEPFHWRGDRDGLEEFNGAFVSLLGDDAGLSPEQMQDFEDFLATITLPPNPFRDLDNSLSTSVPLDGHFTTGRFSMAGQPLGTGNAVTGLNRFRTGFLDRLPQFPNVEVHCNSCHALPTGTSVNGRGIDPASGAPVGGANLPIGPNGENHLGLVGLSTVSEITMKVPQLRTLYDKVGFDLRDAESLSGFGFLHDGAVDTLANLVALQEFDVESDQDVADLVAFLLSFSGSGLPTQNSAFVNEPPPSQDSHAAVGRQVTTAEVTPTLRDLADLADVGAIELVARRGANGWLRTESGRYLPDDGGPTVSRSNLLSSGTVTFTAVAKGLGNRLALDRDGDGVMDGVERSQGSNPADAASNTFAPTQGLWYNPARSGHGIDLQQAGDVLAATWYTYDDDGNPTWYQAVAPFEGEIWTAEAIRYVWDPDGGVSGESVGSLQFSFGAPQSAEFCWTLGQRSGCEPFQRFGFDPERTLRNYTGLWFDPTESGYGLSLDSQGDTRVAVVYFYDADRQPRWVIGQGDNAADNTIAMLSVQGFCPDCDAVPTQTQEGGSLTLSLDFLQRVGTMELDVAYPEVPGSTWQRSEIALVPLTDAPADLDQ